MITSYFRSYAIAGLLFTSTVAISNAQSNPLIKAEAIQMLSNAKQIHLITMAKFADDTAVGQPEDSVYASKKEFIQTLQDDGYLKAEDIPKLRVAEFEIFNITDKDANETLYLLYVDPKDRFAVAMRKSGEGKIFESRAAALAWGKLVERTPHTLP